ncbi:MAG: site-specific DNA-methyltransferase [Clostridia bacterium]
MSDELKMHTPNKADENFKKLAALFPNAVTETIDENGEVVRAIDKDVLMQEISTTVVEGKDERYQFTWPDKKKSILLANAPINKTLRPCKDESVNFDNTENLYIEGDNLEVLKLLQETYLGKIKMIYIDPPYNTGNDFVYEDDFAQSTEKYLGNSGQFDESGNRLVKNIDSNGRFHTDWLNMMYSRLKVAKDLLADDGAIFISIGDEELYNLRKITDEIFGNNNFVANLIWQSTPGSNTGEDVKIVTENILLYSKNRELCKFSTVEITDRKKYSSTDEYFSKRGGYVLNKLDRRMTGSHYSEALNYSIEMPDGVSIYPGGTSEKQEHWNWRWSKTKIEWGIKNGFIVMKKTANSWSVYFKQYEKVDNEDKPIMRTLSYQNLINIEGANSARGTREVMELFDGKYFDYPKPLQLIKHIQNMVLGNDDVILDFFSGSATTAHAVMQLNAEDGGHRKFIMVQLPEETDEKSEAYKAGYKNICEIGKERIRRAAKKIAEENPNAKFDGGFRVLKCDSSNMKDVYYSPQALTMDELLNSVDNIKEDRTPEDLLFQVMLDLGVLLSGKIEETTIAGKKVFSVEGNYLIACFDKDVTEEVVTEIAKQKPYYFVMRDSSMANDSVATNFEQIFNTYSPTTVRKVL